MSLRGRTMTSNEHYRRQIEQLIEKEKASTSGGQAAEEYARVHAARFLQMLAVCTRFVPQKTAHVLDVGRSNLTALLASYYETVWSLGYDLSEDEGGAQGGGVFVARRAYRV